MEFCHAGENRARTYSLQEVVFEYLKSKENSGVFKNIEFESLLAADSKEKPNAVINSELLACREVFDTEYKKNHNALKEIFRILGIIMYLDQWKNKKGEYEFWKNEVDVLCDVLHDFHNSKAWKLFKKVDNRNFDGFLKIYRQNHTEDIFESLKNSVEGLRQMYRNRHWDDKTEGFEKILFVSTQYQQITWIHEMTEIIYSLPPITMDDVEKTIGGKLIYDYQDYLQELKEKISLIVKTAYGNWNGIKEERQREMFSIKHTDALDDAISELRKRISATDEEAGKAVEALFRNEECNLPKPGTKEERMFNERVRNQIIKAFDQLTPDSKNALHSYIGRFMV